MLTKFIKTTCGILALTLCTCCLSGCTGNVEIMATKPMSLEEVTGKRLLNLTNDEKESIVFKYVSDRITVDKDKLIEIPRKDIGVVNSLFSDVNEYLKGNKTGVIPDDFGNYLLLEFAKTPYEWKQVKVEPVGFDPASRLYFVDVSYKTSTALKKIIPDSKIPEGVPNKEVYKQKRYNDYMLYLDAKAKGDYSQANGLLNDFQSSWGNINDIMEEQQGVSLLSRTRRIGSSTGGIGKMTYSGLINSSMASKNTTMTIRYVLKYRFNLGAETDLQVDSVYLKDYNVLGCDKLVESKVLADDGLDVLKPFIDRLITSYHRAVEESNHIGLYSLYDNYQKVDKYYSDISDYEYNSFGGYSYRVLNKSGTTVNILVDRVNKYRAKGSDMSLPTYGETLIFELVLSSDDTLRIKNIVPIKSYLIGEPLSVIKNISGISDTIQYSDISFTDVNKKKVEDTVKSFSNLVLNQDISSDEFLKVVDLGVSQVSLKRMIDTITAIKANKKVTYLVNYNSSTNVFASVAVREVFEGDNSNFDTEANIELVNRDGEWRVVDYVRTLNVKTGKSVLSTKGALCIDKKGV